MKKQALILWESLRFATFSLKSSRMRTLLSLLGVSIGIFCIIAVLAAVDSLKQNIAKEASSLGKEVVYVSKWPWGMGMGVNWDEVRRRPAGTDGEAEALERIMPGIKGNVAFEISNGTRETDVKINGENISGLQIKGITQNYSKAEEIQMASGRFFNDIEFTQGLGVCVVGADIYENIFNSGEDAVGRELYYKGNKFTIIGTLVKEGKQSFSDQKDNRIIIPLNLYKKINIINERWGGDIVVIPTEEQLADFDNFLEELRGHVRMVRRLPANVKDNFSLNVVSMVMNTFESLFMTLNIVGIIIGGFSMLVGGFGIANIMFVSVQERTNQIGIQKALGAKNSFILFQFIFEAIFLALFGGLLGILLVWGGLAAAEAASGSAFYLNAYNIGTGLIISVCIGLASGIIPAYNAARLNPVDAIRTGQ